MRIIYRIAKTELSTLFYSPVAWLVLIIFTIQTGVHFMGTEEFFDTQAQMGARLGPLTKLFFSRPGLGGLFFTVLSNLYLYIPLLTMGLMSRELHSGSIKLLLSSPITVRQIILGKFLAMMIYGLMMLGIVCFFVIAGGLSIRSMDMGLLLAGLFAVYLVLCTYSAIGLFMSSLTSYQVVAAISTMATLGILAYVGKVGQKIPFLRDITYFLSISGRADKMVGGLVTSKDVLYFLIVMTLFLSVAILKIRFSVTRVSVRKRVVKYSLPVVASLMAGYVSSRPLFVLYTDWTRDKTETLTPVSQQIIQQLKGPVTMTTYDNLLDGMNTWAFPENMLDDLSNFEQYVRFMPDLKTPYVYYYDTCDWTRDVYFPQNPGLSLKQLAEKTAKANKVDFDMFLSPEQLKKQINLDGEKHRLVRTVQLGEKKVFLRMFDDIVHYPAEQQISVALKKLVMKSPRVAFLTGDRERSIGLKGDRGFYQPALEVSFRQALINQGFDVDSLALQGQPVPGDVSILVLVDPRMALSSEDREHIAAYIRRGGNMLIAGEPGKQDVLNPILAQLGVQYMPGSIVQPSKDYAADYSLNYFTPQAAAMSKMYAELYKFNSIITMPGVMTIRNVDGSTFACEPILRTDSARAWNKMGVTPTDSAVLFKPEEGDNRGRFMTAAALHRKLGKGEQRIMVLGDADGISNGEIFRRGGDFERLNFYFYEEICRWLGNDEWPVDVARPAPKDDKLIIHTQGISIMRVVLVWIIPGIMVAFCVLLLVRRKRK